MPKDLVKYVTRDYTVLEHSIICEALFRENTSISGIYNEEIVDVSTSGLIDVYLLKKDIERNVQWVRDSAEKDEKFLEKMLEQGLKATAQLEELPSAVLKQPLLRDEAALNVIKELKRKFFAFGGYVDFTHYLGKTSIKLDEKSVKLLSDFHEKRKKAILYFFAFLRNICEKISENKKTKHKNLDWLTIEELVLFLQGKIDKEKVDELQEKRMKRYIARIIPPRFRIMTDNFEEELEKINSRIIKENIGEIKGTGINKGIVKGEVVIIDQKTPLHQIPEGKIIVTQMTHPHMTPVLTKAKAIVTDEGGLLCHAANVAREFGIIAVIGTKNATKLLKNGDIVEVDSTKGTVKKI